MSRQQSAPTTASFENVPDSQFLAYGQQFYHFFFKYNVLSAHIRKNIHFLVLFNKIFGKYLEPRKELGRFQWSKPCKNVGLLRHLS